MKPVLLCLVVLVGAMIPLGSSDAHPGGTAYCGGFSADDKGGLTTYVWTAATTCDTDNHFANVISVGSWLQRAQFTPSGPPQADWETVASLLPIGTRLRFASHEATTGGTIEVPSFFSLNCRRVRSIHAVSHGNTVIYLSQSGGECY